MVSLVMVQMGIVSLAMASLGVTSLAMGVSPRYGITGHGKMTEVWCN
jgi:hypothetical protein